MVCQQKHWRKILEDIFSTEKKKIGTVYTLLTRRFMVVLSVPLLKCAQHKICKVSSDQRIVVYNIRHHFHASPDITLGDPVEICNDVNACLMWMWFSIILSKQPVRNDEKCAIMQISAILLVWILKFIFETIHLFFGLSKILKD